MTQKNRYTYSKRVLKRVFYVEVLKMSKNFWLGNNELLIVFRNGTHHVIESYEDYKTIFTGHFEKCLEYCKNREVAYMESVIG